MDTRARSTTVPSSPTTPRRGGVGFAGCRGGRGRVRRLRRRRPYGGVPRDPGRDCRLRPIAPRPGTRHMRHRGRAVRPPRRRLVPRPHDKTADPRGFRPAEGDEAARRVGSGCFWTDDWAGHATRGGWSTRRGHPLRGRSRAFGAVLGLFLFALGPGALVGTAMGPDGYAAAAAAAAQPMQGMVSRLFPPGPGKRTASRSARSAACSSAPTIPDKLRVSATDP